MSDDEDHDLRYCRCDDCRELFYRQRQQQVWWEDYQYEKNGPRHE